MSLLICLTMLWCIYSATEDEQLPVDIDCLTSWRLKLNFMVLENIVGECGSDQKVTMPVVSRPLFSLVDS